MRRRLATAVVLVALGVLASVLVDNTLLGLLVMTAVAAAGLTLVFRQDARPPSPIRAGHSVAFHALTLVGAVLGAVSDADPGFRWFGVILAAAAAAGLLTTAVTSRKRSGDGRSS